MNVRVEMRLRTVRKDEDSERSLVAVGGRTLAREGRSAARVASINCPSESFLKVENRRCKVQQ